MRPLILAALLIASPAFAAKEKSAKKQAADKATVELPAAQVIEEGDTSVGVRVNSGSAFGGNAIFGIGAEHMFTPNFGALGEFHYSGYTTSFGVGTVTGEFKYRVYALSASATFHADFLKAPNFDPYVSLGLGRSFYSVKWSSSAGVAQPLGSDDGGFFLAAYLNLRYFINSNWGVQLSLGTGYGTFGAGVDYVF